MREETFGPVAPLYRFKDEREAIELANATEFGLAAYFYARDIGRVWPVNGKYAPWQRELLQFILEFRNAVMTRIRPGVTSRQILDEAQKAMEPVFARTKFSKATFEKAARTLVETGGGVFSHTVGMAVHDVGRYNPDPLKPGQVFSVDPQLWVREENLYLRYEDTVVGTRTQKPSSSRRTRRLQAAEF